MMRRDRAQAMVIRNKQILMVKHCISDRIFYCLPGGGIEKDETPEQAALRELEEESCVIGKIVRKLSIQFKPDDKGEVYTFLVEISEDEVPKPGTDPELSEEEQTIQDVAWMNYDDLTGIDQAYLWASGLIRVDEFHDELQKRYSSLN